MLSHVYVHIILLYSKRIELMGAQKSRTIGSGEFRSDPVQKTGTGQFLDNKSMVLHFTDMLQNFYLKKVNLYFFVCVHGYCQKIL